MIAFLLSLAACFDTDADTGSASTTGTGAPTWGSFYGSCESASSTSLAVTADQLGEPLSILVEFEGNNGWVQVGFEPDPTMTNTPIVRRDDEGLWLMCPAGASQWHVSWASAPG